MVCPVRAGRVSDQVRSTHAGAGQPSGGGAPSPWEVRGGSRGGAGRAMATPPATAMRGSAKDAPTLRGRPPVRAVAVDELSAAGWEAASAKAVAGSLRRGGAGLFRAHRFPRPRCGAHGEQRDRRSHGDRRQGTAELHEDLILGLTGERKPAAATRGGKGRSGRSDARPQLRALGRH